MHHALFGFFPALAILPCFFICGFGSFGLLAFAFWIWMLVDCAANEPSQGTDKIAWILVLVFASFIGALIYFFVRRPQRIKDTGH